MLNFRNSKEKSKSKHRKNYTPKPQITFRRHLLPPLVGLTVMALVFIVLNGEWLAAQINYHFAKPQPAVVAAASVNNPQTAPDPSAPSEIYIPKIDAKAPIIFEPSTDESKIQVALRQGVDHYGASAKPGQAGNVVIFGHSSGQLWAPGKYKYIFTLLNKLQPNDQIVIDYQGRRYIYTVTSSEVILPTNLSVLNQTNSTPALTLITCTPVGTNKYRLVVHASQSSPNPINDTKPAKVSAQSLPQLPGSAHASIWQTLTSWL